MNSKFLRTSTLGLALLCIGLLFLARNLFLPISVYDEGLVLCCASRVFQGELPFGDFWSLYAPGQFYALAAIYSLFGESVVSERLFDLAIRGFLALSVFWLLRRAVSRGMALAGFLVALTWLWFFEMPGYPVYPFLLCAFVGIGALVEAVDNSSWKWGGVAAGAVGLSAIFRHDMGVLLLGAMTAALFGLALVVRLRGPSNSHGLWRLAILFPLGGAVPILLVYGGLLAAGCGPGMLGQLVLNSRTYPAFRGLPYPSVPRLDDLAAIDSLTGLGQFMIYSGLPVVLPAILLAAILYAAVSAWSKSRLGKLDLLVCLLCGAGLATVPQATMRSDMKHFLPWAMVSIVLFYLLAEVGRRRFPRAGLALVALATACWCAPLGKYTRPDSTEIPGLGQDLRAAIDYLKQNHPGAPLYVGVENHDRFVVNDTAVYFLSGAAYGTRYHWLEPGVTTTAKVQTEIIGELERNAVPVVVLTEGFWEEPNESSRDQGIDLLDRYISENFQSVARFGEYRILERRPGPSGASGRETTP